MQPMLVDVGSKIPFPLIKANFPWKPGRSPLPHQDFKSLHTHKKQCFSIKGDFAPFSQGRVIWQGLGTLSIVPFLRGITMGV